MLLKHSLGVEVLLQVAIGAAADSASAATPRKLFVPGLMSATRGYSFKVAETKEINRPSGKCKSPRHVLYRPPGSARTGVLF